MKHFSRQRVIGTLVTVVACIVGLIFLYWLVFMKPAQDRRAKRSAEVAGALSDSRTQSATDAGVILDGAHADATASEQLSRETEDAIRQAPGADVRLDPALNRTARQRLCERPAYRGRPECVQQPGRAEPAR